MKNIPNAAKLMSSLRHLDYSEESAICDLIDNSIDAEASIIKINVEAGEKNEIIEKIQICDNGKGMSKETLEEAMKLGSNTVKNPECDLGLYGMGLITSSISLGRRLCVMTTQEDYATIYEAIQDLDEITHANDFVITCNTLKPNPETKEHLAKSGTIVEISKIDKIQSKTLNSFVKNLKRSIGQTFRKYIQSQKVEIWLNDEEVKAIDPIHDFNGICKFEDSIILKNGNIDIKVYEIADYGMETNKMKGINIANQGFYVLRNNREICSGVTLGIFTKHPASNFIRIEMEYPATLDEEIHVNFSKQRIALTQSMKDKIKQNLSGIIRQLKAQRTKTDIENQEDIDFSDAEKHITQKSGLLKLPKGEKEKRASGTRTSENSHERSNESSGERNFNKSQPSGLTSKAKFIVGDFSEMGPLYAAEKDRNIIVITWNKSHPFYQRMLAPKNEEPDIKNPITYLVYCLAASELDAPEETFEVLLNLRADMSRNLAVLLRN